MIPSYYKSDKFDFENKYWSGLKKLCALLDEKLHDKWLTIDHQKQGEKTESLFKGDVIYFFFGDDNTANPLRVTARFKEVDNKIIIVEIFTHNNYSCYSDIDFLNGYEIKGLADECVTINKMSYLEKDLRRNSKDIANLKREIDELTEERTNYLSSYYDGISFLSTAETKSKFDSRSILVKKRSGKPFKSGLLLNSVKSIEPNPEIEHESVLTFHEDDSYVSIVQCEFNEDYSI